MKSVWMPLFAADADDYLDEEVSQLLVVGAWRRLTSTSNIGSMPHEDARSHCLCSSNI